MRYLYSSLIFTISIDVYSNKLTNIVMPVKYSTPDQLILQPKEDDEFLETISQLESSGRKDVEHPILSTGIHKGTSAIGEFGLMPSTIREIAKRIKNKDESLGLSPVFSGDPELERYADDKVSDDELTNTVKSNPELARRTAKYLKEYLKNKHLSNEDKMAYGWFMGHNIPSSEITEDKLESSPYVSKFKKLRTLFNK